MPSLTQRRNFRFYAAFLAGVLFVLGCAFSLYYAKYTQAENTARIHDFQNRQIRALMQDIGEFFNQKSLELAGMADLWQVIDHDDGDMWRERAKQVADPAKGLRVVEWADKSFHIRWAHPLEGNENVSDMSIIFDKKREEALKNAGRRRTSVFTPPLDLVQGYKGVILYLPIYVYNQFNGFIIGVFDVSQIAETNIARNFDENFRIDIFIEDELVHTAYFSPKLVTEAIPLVDSAYIAAADINIHGKHWSARVSPTAEYLRRERHTKPVYLFLAGVGMAALAALAAYICVTAAGRIYARRKAAAKHGEDEGADQP